MRKNGKRRLIQGLIRGTVMDVVVPTSLGLGLALAAGGCGDTEAKSVDGSSDAAADSGKLDSKPYDGPIYAIMPPIDAAADSGKLDSKLYDGPIYAIMPPIDAAADSGKLDGKPYDGPIYAIMPPKG